MRGALLVALAAAAAGCADPCTRMPTYPYADVRLDADPSNDTLDPVLRDLGWTLREGPGAHATHPLPYGRTAQLHVGTPRGAGLFVSADGGNVRTEDESRALLADVVDPLARLLGGEAVYHGGPEHCGEV